VKQTYEFLSRGGPVMAILAVASVLCLALIFERWHSLRRRKIFPVRFLSEIENLLREGKISETLTLCRTSDLGVARLISTGLALKDAPSQESKEELEGAGRREASILERNLDFLGTLAAAGPLVGLLGTVIGMIRTFGVVALTGVGDPLKLSGGIAEALLCTVGGLVVGIPALVAQQYFLHKVDRFMIEMEEFVTRVMKLIRRGV